MTEKKNITPTEEQEAVLASTSMGKESLLIQAYAGAAKTTTLEMAAQRVKVPGLALAFNRHIKKELAGRFPGNFSVQTMNGLGHSSIIRQFPSVSFVLDQKKLGRLIGEVARDWKTEVSSDQWDEVRRLASAVMARGLVPKDEGRPLLPDTPENWQLIADDLFIDPQEQEFLISLAREVIERDIAEVKKGNLSYDDQVYFSVCIAGRFPQFPVLFGDEIQDFSPLNHQMITLASRPDARLFMCGDELQAIYAFRGADANSVANIAKLRSQWGRLPLTMSFRCSKEVVRRQLWHAKGFRAAPWAPDGAFHALPGAAQLTWDMEGVFGLLPAPGASLAVLCRNNAPLLSLAFKLLRRRISVTMLGRDIGAGLKTLSQKLFPSGHESPEEMASRLTEWEEKEVGMALANGKEEKVDSIRDRAECIRAVMSFTEVRDARDLRREIDSLFSREEGRVTLSSIHKAKGLEWDAVLLLDPWRLPAKAAKMAAARGDEAPLQQEHNLRYVAETRARHTLIHASLEDFE